MLLELPDPCLLAVLRETSEPTLYDLFNQRSLINAARAHSRLLQLAVQVLPSIRVELKKQQQADSMVQYLVKHGQNIDSLEFWGAWPLEDTPSLQKMPPLLHLTSLQLLGLRLQLRPGDGVQGVLGPAAAASAPPLKQLKLESCELLDGQEGLAAALSLLPVLESLEISTHSMQDPCLRFPTDVLTANLHQLTSLTLHGVTLQGPSQQVLEQWQGLSRLESLDLKQHIYAPVRYTIPAALLQNAHHLTRMVLENFTYEPAVLDSKAKLQHLKIHNSWGRVVWGTWATHVLSHLQHLKHLTHLDLGVSLKDVEGSDPPAVAYSALTASSKLRFINISMWVLPAGAWQHMFPAGRQLPHLTSLDISGVKEPGGGSAAAAPEGSRLVSCCPGLQSLNIQGLRCTAGTLAPLQGLSALHKLCMGTNHGDVQGLQEVVQLTGLRELFVWAPNSEDVGLLMQLTQLKQLTGLVYDGQWDGCADVYRMKYEVRGV
jgi:hypothetical protein